MSVKLAESHESIPVQLRGTTTLTVTVKIDGNTSDGYHTFNELYEHRHALFSVICKKHNGWKNKKHAKEDEEMYEGYFIAGIDTPNGPVQYHMPLSWWDRYQMRGKETCTEMGRDKGRSRTTFVAVVTRGIRL
jgi:hypothetical protein